VSSTIVHGRVIDVHAEWIDGRRALETFVTIEPTEYLKGVSADALVVRVPGGQLGRYRTIIVGAPEFARGDEVVLFLRGSRFPVIVGLNEGAFRVVDRDGRRVVTSPVLMGTAADGADPIVRGALDRRPLTVAGFQDLVRRVVATGAAQ
jgi:hypothetical protein